MSETLRQYPTGRLTAIHPFNVGSLHVRGDQLGKRFEGKRDGRRVWIQMPGRDQIALGESGIKGRVGDEDDPSCLFKVALIHVGVDVGEPDPKTELRDILADGEAIARNIVRHLLDWARTKDRQPWLDPPHIDVEPSSAAWVCNAAGARSIGVGSERMVLAVFEGGAPSGDLRTALDGGEIDEAESLLAEAIWAVWVEREAHTDPKRAVLLATIALEVKASETLQEMATAETRPLLELLLKGEPSIKTMTRKIVPALGGESLQEHDGHLAKRVQGLVDLRNDVAHRGVTPSDPDARSAVGAAEEVFAWLDSQRLGASDRT